MTKTTEKRKELNGSKTMKPEIHISIVKAAAGFLST